MQQMANTVKQKNVDIAAMMIKIQNKRSTEFRILCRCETFAYSLFFALWLSTPWSIVIVMVLTRSVWTPQPQQSGAQLGQVEQRGEQTQIAASSNI